jgi:hypothetical protein
VLGARFLGVGKRSDGMVVGGFVGRHEGRESSENWKGWYSHAGIPISLATRSVGRAVCSSGQTASS